MQSEWGWNIGRIGKLGKMIESKRIVNGRIVKGYMERKERSMSIHTLKGGEMMEEMWMNEYVKEYGEWIEEVMV